MENIQMIFGAPGCGKTTHLMAVLEEQLKVNEPDKIAFVSFTKKGSYEGRDRAMKQFNYKEKDFPYFRTIHSLAFRALQMSRYDIVSRKNYREFSTAMGMNFLGYYTEDLVNNDDRYLFYDSLRKNNLRAAENFSSQVQLLKAANVSMNYQRYKETVGVKDFDDLLIDFIKRGVPIPVDIAIIDEAQDLTTLQWKFCEVAFRDCSKVYIAGDDDQAIYEWSGADVEYFLTLRRSETKILEQSYRLKKNVLHMAKRISSKIKNRVEKNFNPVDLDGSIKFYHNLDELPVDSENSYYFLSRNNYFLRKCRDHLMKMGQTFQYKNDFSVSPSVVNAIVNYERHRKEQDLAGVKADLSLRKYLRTDFRLSNPWYDSFSLDFEEINYYRDLVKNKASTAPHSKVVVNTIHGVKGGEAENVVLLMDLTKNVYKALEYNLDAELRCLYVGITRTKTNLHIVHSSSAYGYEDIAYELF